MLHEMIRAEAQKLLANPDVLADKTRHTCCDIIAKVQSEYWSSGLVQIQVRLQIEAVASKFLQNVLADPIGVLGFDIPDAMKNQFDKVVYAGGAFVHRLARDRDETDMEKFVATRRAWLKFLTENV